jgi:thiosulfate dehydrogenase
MRVQNRVATLLLPLALASAQCSREKSAGPASAEADLGAKIFNRTQLYSQALGANALACTNCHLDGGKQAAGLSLVGASRKYPVDGPDGSKITLSDRIARCFTHSLAGKAPEASSPEAKALLAYITWLSEGLPAGPLPAGLRPGAIASQNIVPIGQLNAQRGRMKFDQYCSPCHGLDGQGYREKRTPLPYDYVPPVWGQRSYDDAAGFARVYTLAGFVRHAMPNDQPGGITDLEAQEIAAFVDGQPRPAYPDKAAWDGALPFDAVYDTKQYPKNPFFVPLDQ